MFWQPGFPRDFHLSNGHVASPRCTLGRARTLCRRRNRSRQRSRPLLTSAEPDHLRTVELRHPVSRLSNVEVVRQRKRTLRSAQALQYAYPRRKFGANFTNILQSDFSNENAFL